MWLASIPNSPGSHDGDDDPELHSGSEQPGHGSGSESNSRDSSETSDEFYFIDVAGRARNVIQVAQYRDYSLRMTKEELLFWQVEQEVRVRTEGLTAAEVDQLLMLPSINNARVKMLGTFPAKDCRNELLAWVGELAPTLPPPYKSPGHALPIHFPIWTLCKGVLLSERRSERETGYHASFNCHCMPRTSFMIFGCPCQINFLPQDISQLPFLEGSLCTTCSFCVRCQQ